MSKRCGRQLNAIARLSRKLSRDCKLRLMNAFIMSNFNFCSVVYHHCKISDTRKLEKLQERALRYVYDDFESEYKVLLQVARKPTLFEARQKIMMECVFKILHNMLPPMKTDFF